MKFSKNRKEIGGFEAPEKQEIRLQLTPNREVSSRKAYRNKKPEGPRPTANLDTSAPDFWNTVTSPFP